MKPELDRDREHRSPDHRRKHGCCPNKKKLFWKDTGDGEGGGGWGQKDLFSQEKLIMFFHVPFTVERTGF